MVRKLILPVAVTWALTLSLGHADEPRPQEGKNEQSIRAEVTGTLHFESGRGYFVSVTPTDKAVHPTRVWLRAAEDKALVRQLQGLDGKEVVAKGNLGQMPQDVGANVPPLGIYLQHGFTIERAGAK
jgi:hypothetical protein